MSFLAVSFDIKDDFYLTEPKVPSDLDNNKTAAMFIVLLFGTTVVSLAAVYRRTVTRSSGSIA